VTPVLGNFWILVFTVNGLVLSAADVVSN